jgi:hypothetical protein
VTTGTLVTLETLGNLGTLVGHLVEGGHLVSLVMTPPPSLPLKALLDLWPALLVRRITMEMTNNYKYLARFLKFVVDCNT